MPDRHPHKGREAKRNCFPLHCDNEAGCRLKITEIPGCLERPAPWKGLFAKCSVDRAEREGMVGGRGGGGLANLPHPPPKVLWGFPYSCKCQGARAAERRESNCTDKHLDTSRRRCRQANSHSSVTGKLLSNNATGDAEEASQQQHSGEAGFVSSLGPSQENSPEKWLCWVHRHLRRRGDRTF